MQKKRSYNLSEHFFDTPLAHHNFKGKQEG
jgi:hypothetical protein